MKKGGTLISGIYLFCLLLILFICRWLGYSDEKIRRLCKEAVNEGYTHIKIKVGQNLEDDIRRCTIIREEIGI